MSQLAYLWLKYKAMAWLAVGGTAPASRIFDDMLRRWPTDAHALASRAHLYSGQQRSREALEDLTLLVQKHPQHAAYWFNFGFALEAAGRLDEALSAFVRATDLDPRLDRAWYGQALVLIRQRRLDEAIVALKRNTELQPMSPYGWYQLARVYVDRQDRDEAMRVIRHLKGFEPKVAAQLERETGLRVDAQPS